MKRESWRSQNRAIFYAMLSVNLLFLVKMVTISSMISDECLSRGKKRKLSQRTFMQLDFLRPKVKFHSIQPDDNGNQDILTDPSKRCCDTIRHLNASHDFEEDDNYQNNASIDSVTLQSDQLASCMDSPLIDDSTNYKCVSLSLSLENEMPNYVMEKPVEDCDISKVFLHTFIVGRKFSSVEELDPGSTIRLSREPENVKDPNAVKVQFYYLILCLLRHPLSLLFK